MKIFPFMIIRVTGKEFDEFEKLNAKKSINLINEILQYKVNKKLLIQHICDNLYAILSESKSESNRHFFLNAKRSIYNDKTKSIDFNLLSGMVNDETNKLILDYEKIENEIQKTRSLFHETYNNELLNIRNLFESICNSDALRNGLLLSSTSLLKRLNEHIENDQSIKDKNYFRTELSLIKYISRVYTKTSPFSSFTKLILAELSDKLDNNNFYEVISSYNCDIFTPNSFVRLNNSIFVYLKTLLIKVKDVYECLSMKVNPTINLIDGYYSFLINSNNIEAFQKIKSNNVINLLIDLVSKNNNTIKYKDLIEIVVNQELFDASKDDIENYLNRLIEYGLFEYEIDVSALDTEWDQKLISFLSKINHIDEVKRIIRTLILLRKYAKEYSLATFKVRDDIINYAFEELKKLSLFLHERAGLPEFERKYVENVFNSSKKEIDKIEQDIIKDNKGELTQNNFFQKRDMTLFYFKPQQVFYEDTTYNFNLKIDSAKVKVFVDNLNYLVNNLSSFEIHLEEQDKLFAFFSKKFDTAKDVKLVEFYEYYYKNFKIHEIKNQKDTKQHNKKDTNAKNENIILDNHNQHLFDDINQLQFTLSRQRAIINEQFLIKFKSNFDEQLDANNLGYNIKKEIIQNINGNNFQKKPKDSLISQGSFVQFYVDINHKGEEVLKGVVNATFGGFGKLFSRFLHLFPNELTDAQQKYNLIDKKDIFLSEISDAASTNANLHPPLMPFEIRMPGGFNVLPKDKQIDVNDILISIDKEKQELMLLHRVTKQRIFTFDLGFLSITARSSLFQLLENFTLSKVYPIYPLIEILNSFSLNNYVQDKERVIIYPRISFENNIIIQRKYWTIPTSIIPKKDKNDTEEFYFFKINEWKTNLNLPTETFVYISNMDKLRKDAKEGKTVNFDNYKPQYICFENPLLIKLFEKIVKKSNSIKIVEMLPNSKQLLKFKKNRFATEFVLQWYS